MLILILSAPQHPCPSEPGSPRQQRIVEFPMSMPLELVVQLLYSVFSVVLYDIPSCNFELFISVFTNPGGSLFVSQYQCSLSPQSCLS